MTRDAIATDKLAAHRSARSRFGVRGVGLLFLSGQVAQGPGHRQADRR